MLFELQGCISHCGNYSHILLQLKRFCLLEAMDEPISNPEVKYRQLFINNEFVPAKDGCTFLTENPATGQPICNVSEAKKADVDDAVAAAKAAFKPGSKWRKMKPSERGVLLNKLADLILRDRQYLASLESMDAGKLYSVVYFGDIQSSVEMLRYYAGWADKEHGKTVPMGDDFFAYTKHEPVGVCGGILPWNAPLLLCCVKLGPCLAMGNVLVLKPSELTPLSALYFAALIKEAGFPPGVVNMVPGFGVTAGDALSHHPDVDKISFTGSVNTGRLVMKAAADSNLKKVSLELGGKSPNIIFSDVDLDYAVEMAHVAIFTHSGQICCAGSRTFVQEDIYDEFVKRSLKRATKGALGDPLDLKTRHGPQISKLQKDKILGYIKSGKDEGCTVLCGGGAVEDRSGHYVQPTILTDLTDDMRVSKEEIFGPVQQIFKFKDVAEVIERANNTTYGLAAAVFTKDINKALAISNSLQAGMVWVNCYYAMGPSLTFGGYKQSGIGREMGEYALKEYTEVKSVIVKIDTPMK